MVFSSALFFFFLIVAFFSSFLKTVFIFDLTVSSHSLCRLFSGCGGWGLFSSDCRGHCSGFSCRRAGAPGRVDSSSFRVQAQSLWRMGSVCGLWNILGPGIQSISPALQGGPPATGPSEKPLAPLSTPGNSNLYDGGLRRFWDVIGVFAR